MCDEFGGEDLLKRLAPKTWQWAVLEACRAAAKKVDDAARSSSEDADHLISLYRFGFEVDEHLDDRLRELKLSERPPSEVFPDLADLMKEWSRDSFQSWVASHGEAQFTATATGRRLRGEMPSDTSDAAKQLVAGLGPAEGQLPTAPLPSGAMSVPALAESHVSETTESHTHLLRCALALDESRAYWARVDSDDSRPRAEVAFEEYWFGAKSLPWVKLLIANMRVRFDAFPDALAVLQRWHDMLPETRAAICHWHVQLTDPIYRRFSGDYLTERHHALRPEVRRTSVISWLADQVPEGWTLNDTQTDGQQASLDGVCSGSSRRAP